MTLATTQILFVDIHLEIIQNSRPTRWTGSSSPRSPSQNRPVVSTADECEFRADRARRTHGCPRRSPRVGGGRPLGNICVKRVQSA